MLNFRSIIPRRHVRRSWYYTCTAHFGAYSRFGPKDLGDVRRFVFVCTGNICRSPFAEFLARAVGVDAVSYGLSTQRGLMADASARRAAQRRGISMETHKTRPFHDAKILPHDLIVAMEPKQIHVIGREYAPSSCGVVLLGMWADAKLPYIFDPYGMTDPDFDRCFDLIQVSTQRLIAQCRLA